MSEYPTAQVLRDDHWTTWIASSASTVGTTYTTNTDIVWVTWQATSDTSIRITTDPNHPDLGAQHTLSTIRRNRAKQEKARQNRIHRANAKAELLLKENLTEEELAEYGKNNCITIQLKDALYRITRGLVDNIYEMDANKITRATLCVRIDDANIPIADHMLAQYLYLKNCPEELFRIANRHPVYNS